MILCAVVCLVSGAVLAAGRKKESWHGIRSPCLVWFLFGLLGLCCGMADAGGADGTSAETVKRKPPGEGDLETEAYVYLAEEDTEYVVTLSIPEQKYTHSKERELLAAAVTEMEQTFCGGNTSLYEITQNPDVRESYQDGAVTAEWTFSERTLISGEGELDLAAVKRQVKKAKRVEASVVFSCGESRREHRFAFFLVPGKISRREAVQLAVEERIAAQDRTNGVVALPKSVDGQTLVWRAPPPVKPEELLGFGALAAAAVWYAAKEKRKQEQERRRRDLFLSYPEFVSKLSLLLGAGMGIGGALRKMDRMYAAKRAQGGKKEEVYEALRRMVCEMENGMGEFRAYRAFSEDCDLQPYRKLASLLVSGQKAGNRRLLAQLNEEADRVFAERKNAARRLGEEAGTKLLLPMMMMLVVVMGIVIIPAFLSIYGI